MYECNENFLFAESGEGGIRTLGTFPPTRFPVVPNRPLSHLSEETKKAQKTQFLGETEFTYQNGGEGGIRTHVTTFGRQTDFESVPL